METWMLFVIMIVFAVIWVIAVRIRELRIYENVVRCSRFSKHASSEAMFLATQLLNKEMHRLAHKYNIEELKENLDQFPLMPDVDYPEWVMKYAKEEEREGRQFMSSLSMYLKKPDIRLHILFIGLLLVVGIIGITAH